MVLGDERKAREIATVPPGQVTATSSSTKLQAAKLENMFDADGRGTPCKTLALIVKADVQGSATRRLTQALTKLSTGEVKVQHRPRRVWAASPRSDVNLALASKAVIIGFNTRADVAAPASWPRSSGVDIRYYNIIYDAVDDVKAAMTGMLAPEQREEVIGTAEIRQVFVASKIGTVAGSMVTAAWCAAVRACAWYATTSSSTRARSSRCAA